MMAQGTRSRHRSSLNRRAILEEAVREYRELPHWLKQGGFSDRIKNKMKNKRGEDKMPARLKNPTLDALARGSKTVRVTERDHPSGNTLTGFLSAMGSCLWVTNGYMEMHFLEEEVELISTTGGDSEVDAVITLRPYKE